MLMKLVVESTKKVDYGTQKAEITFKGSSPEGVARAVERYLRDLGMNGPSYSYTLEQLVDKR
ncbi:hypothetical protein CC53_gp137 [Rhizobium phage vB_RleS_L338C]|uniref:hypothetical protein n=1 Tax=Rhizobium phage vB_RleS_L338C TaxID=1414737 RepID=UPI0003D7FB32|nr:hypothetical protein CC53_gp137 [Rhizobium phage vB_RleS_L338C]AHC30554.1 hypothetical protein L338C_137 [Rhizobium phage vB_RleS_L338C]QNH72190.1 hypothetical protein P11VFA_012 [Rhizobium phage P11VFA]